MVITYKINEAAGVVSCTLSDCKFDAIDELNKHANLVNLPHKKFLMPDKFTCSAKCAKEDKFEQFKGEDIAFDRAYANYLKSKKKKIHKIIEAYRKDLTSIENCVDTCKKLNK